MQVCIYYSENKKDYNDSLEKATLFAQQYLEEKYDQEMVYVKHTSIYDKMVWTITFAESNNQEKSYTVHVNESYDRDQNPVKKVFSISK